MQWADVTVRPSAGKLRQFAGLWLLFFLTLAGWRALHGRQFLILAALGIIIGTLGLVRPAATRWVYTGWMIAAFPLGWTVSKLMLAVLFYGVFTPVSLAFRILGRDSLGMRRRHGLQSYWAPKPGVLDVRDYFRQF
jgi:hypothetical protein